MPNDPFARALTDVFLNQAAEFVGIYDASEGRFTRVNSAGVALLGYASEAALLAEPHRALRTPGFSDAEWALLCERAQATGGQEQETEVSRPDGSTFLARIELTPFAVESAPFFPRSPARPKPPAPGDA